MSDISPTSSTAIIAWLLAIIGTVGGILLKRNGSRLDSVENANKEFLTRAELDHKYANKDHMAALDVRVAGLVSRREFLAHMDKLREDQIARHAENKETLADVRRTMDKREDDAQEFRHEIRNTINAVAIKLNVVSTIQTERGK